MTFDDTAIDWLAKLLSDAAIAEIMPRFRRLDEGEVRQKTSAADLVTQADVNAERLITVRLRERYPQAMIVGEEACSDDPALLQGLGEADLAFVIDPVDGTFNFASGVPLFGVMLGVVVKGETVAGIIHDPVGKDWLIGAKGAGSHIRHAHGTMEKVHVAEPAPISQMTGAVSWQYMPEPERSRLARNQTKSLSQFGYRCAAHEYRLLASGHAHFVVYNKLMPWDHLAGVLIHAEAGGYSARFDGSAYLPWHVGGGLLVAPDEESWRELRRELWAE
ncbi:inositol monophosphatase family protein [Mesorhizobium sp.]|uniref:inositol monophosphatase family protein n=1 Tax=Mesorhizobium sp. TaxID=1871066 RepID=UPI000FE8FBDC|nr:inositol monophosphatase family protein [Mesorhizobium sp.]RWK61725.1 MAG: inositol monophosphatase [Mesorhizobium sp.]RWM47754.1 MAG: inositol monophosphatase [Mesorhizobium sp.]RWM54709.1 MAG: inositol monophosphatase [Mesorhizobium sp.]RWM59479.1 MAG: inositol monophosphatase [Mesorhizobium sp.]RWN02486.1 MAG: inositol monophosphatase [Mesorhizobium sp.]